MEITILLISAIVLAYIIYYAIIGVKNEEFDEFPYKFEELNITETTITKFSECYYIGSSYFNLIKFPMTKVYFYNNFLVLNYRGHAQLFEYDRNTMSIKKDFRGLRISILTENKEAYIFVNKKQAEIFKSLLYKNR